MCNIEVYGKIAHPFVMQYLVYFLASSASLNAIFTFQNIAYDFKYRKRPPTCRKQDETNRYFPSHVKVF